MIVGDTYAYNFAASPSGSGTFLGWTDFGWVIFAGGSEEGVRFYNLALLCTIRPESWRAA